MREYEPILVRNREIYAERIYTSDRGDYIVYRKGQKVYVVRTVPSPSP